MYILIKPQPQDWVNDFVTACGRRAAASGDIGLCLGEETPPSKPGREKRKSKERSLESPSTTVGEDVN